MATYAACLAVALVSAVAAPVVDGAASPMVPLGLKVLATLGVTFSRLSGGSELKQSSCEGRKIVTPPFTPRTKHGIGFYVKVRPSRLCKARPTR